MHVAAKIKRLPLFLCLNRHDFSNALLTYPAVVGRVSDGQTGFESSGNTKGGLDERQ